MVVDVHLFRAQLDAEIKNEVIRDLQRQGAAINLFGGNALLFPPSRLLYFKYGKPNVAKLSRKLASSLSRKLRKNPLSEINEISVEIEEGVLFNTVIVSTYHLITKDWF